MAEITNAEITEDLLKGTGVLDILMQAMTKSLDDQFKKSRITGKDYADVYLGTVNALVPQAIAYVLGKQQADKQAELIQKQTDLVTEQILKETLERDLLGLEATLKTAQITKLAADTSLVTKQEEAITEQLLKEVLERNILAQEDLLRRAQIAKVNVEALNVTQNTANALTTNAKILAETSLLADQELKIVAETALLNTQDDLTNQQRLKAVEETRVVVKQETKVQSEIDLLNQKTETEHAQVSDTWLDNATPVTGILGKQMDLFAQQKIGYEDNTKQKLLATIMDTTSIMMSNNNLIVPPDGLAKNNINDIINVCRDAVGLAASVAPTDNVDAGYEAPP